MKINMVKLCAAFACTERYSKNLFSFHRWVYSLIFWVIWIDFGAKVIAAKLGNCAYLDTGF